MAWKEIGKNKTQAKQTFKAADILQKSRDKLPPPLSLNMVPLVLIYKYLAVFNGQIFLCNDP